MGKSEFRARVEHAVSGTQNGVSPWFSAWMSGRLNRDMLGEFAKQHFHFISNFPRWCASVYANSDNEDIRVHIMENLMEEEGDSAGAAGILKRAMYIYPLDLEGATYQHYEDLATTLEKEFGRLDGLLHNAAILGARMMIEQYDLKLWARVMHINLTAPFLLSRACLPLMRKSDDARVVFTTTDVAHTGRAYWGAYAVSKAGADNLMQIMADELEVNTAIRVNSIDPGAVATRIRRLAFPAEDVTTLPSTESVMPAYLYLMGPDSKNEIGQIFLAQSS